MRAQEESVTLDNGAVAVTFVDRGTTDASFVLPKECAGTKVDIQKSPTGLRTELELQVDSGLIKSNRFKA